MNMRTRSATALVVIGLVGGLATVTTTAAAHSTGIHDNCTNFNDKYPHGAGRRHAEDKTSGTPVTSFKRSNRVYNRAVDHNSDLDRDNDKIACEKA